MDSKNYLCMWGPASSSRSPTTRSFETTGRLLDRQDTLWTVLSKHVFDSSCAELFVFQDKKQAVRVFPLYKKHEIRLVKSQNSLCSCLHMETPNAVSADQRGTCGCRRSWTKNERGGGDSDQCKRGGCCAIARVRRLCSQAWG
jgi:hypothetical protein